MIKDATQPYPTRAGQRIWHKLKSRRSLDMLAVGVVGDPVAPTSLVLAMPTPNDEPRAAGATTVLTRAAAQAIAPLSDFTGQTWQRRSSWGTTEQGASTKPGAIHWRDFLDATGTLHIGDTGVTCALNLRSHHPALIDAGFADLRTPVPWLGGRALRFRFPPR